RKRLPPRRQTPDGVNELAAVCVSTLALALVIAQQEQDLASDPRRQVSCWPDAHDPPVDQFGLKLFAHQVVERRHCYPSPHGRIATFWRRGQARLRLRLSASTFLLLPRPHRRLDAPHSPNDPC